MNGMNEVNVELFQVLSRSRSGDRKRVEVIFADRQQLDLRKPTLLSFDITAAVRRWLSAGSKPESRDKVENGVLELGLHSSDEEKEALLEQLLSGLTNEEGERASPRLLVFSHSPSKIAQQHRQRIRRQASTGFNQSFCYEPPRLGGRRCCVRQLYIDFRRDFQWNFVNFPRGYFANHCSGRCRFRWGEDTSHAQLLTFHRLNNPMASAQPCCTAKQLEALNIIYQDQDGVMRVLNIPEMSVKSCTCRWRVFLSIFLSCILDADFVIVLPKLSSRFYFMCFLKVVVGHFMLDGICFPCSCMRMYNEQLIFWLCSTPPPSIFSLFPISLHLLHRPRLFLSFVLHSSLSPSLAFSFFFLQDDSFVSYLFFFFFSKFHQVLKLLLVPFPARSWVSSSNQACRPCPKITADKFPTRKTRGKLFFCFNEGLCWDIFGTSKHHYSNLAELAPTSKGAGHCYNVQWSTLQ